MAETTPPKGSDGNEDEQSDIGALARQYVDLWQQQLSSVASDEALASMMAQTVQLMNTGAAAMASYATQNDNGGNNDGGDTGAAPVAASSRPDNDVVDELHRRIDRLEKRISALESGTDDPGA